MINLSTILRKSTAAVLLLVFSLVLGAKAFHTHELEQPQAKGIIISSIASNCDLCDFHLSRDAELPVVNECAVPVKHAQEFLLNSPVNFYSVSPAQFPGRGPPVA